MYATLFPVGVVALIVHITCLMVKIVSVNFILKNSYKNIFLKIVDVLESLSSITFLIVTVLLFFTFHSLAFSMTCVLLVLAIILLARSIKKAKTSSPANSTEETKPTSVTITQVLKLEGLAVLTGFIMTLPYIVATLFR